MARQKSAHGSTGRATSGRAIEAAADADRASAKRDLPPVALVTSQKRYLRSLAHTLKPVILVGAKGVTPALLTELGNALEHHELVKVKIAAEDRDERDVWVAEIAKGVDAALIQRVGNIATLYRARKKNPGIVLPR